MNDGRSHEKTRGTLFYDDSPEVGADRVPIVLLPGGSLNSSYLIPLANRLVQAGHRVVRIEARGTRAEGDGRAVTMHTFADEVAAVMARLELPPSWIAGHAFGNRVARTVALDFPGRVHGLILLAAGGTVTPSAEAQEALRIAFSDVTDSEAEAAMIYMVGDPGDAVAAWHAIKEARDPGLGAVQRTANLATPQEEWAPIRPGAKALIIQGTRDQIAPPANGEQLAASNPGNTRLLSIDGAGHLFPFLQPEETARKVLDSI
ncbi:alpha/beta hydrolase [Microbacterium esteraromaticum]|uniref:alpha/beta fold hydrolase n=1 Tax=Microbacterium esteraromaticum TaxID=57043 RepID=UPI0023683D07|nr:alpha/beta hydrolase [Microbacterium esteraromaticum]WDH78077.1 alpha/beta hydrolase [Microbacterium esteraromaticum]